jgi:hypothetical protein
MSHQMPRQRGRGGTLIAVAVEMRPTCSRARVHIDNTALDGRISFWARGQSRRRAVKFKRRTGQLGLAATQCRLFGGKSGRTTLIGRRLINVRHPTYRTGRPSHEARSQCWCFVKQLKHSASDATCRFQNHCAVGERGTCRVEFSSRRCNPAWPTDTLDLEEA